MLGIYEKPLQWPLFLSNETAHLRSITGAGRGSSLHWEMLLLHQLKSNYFFQVRNQYLRFWKSVFDSQPSNRAVTPQGLSSDGTFKQQRTCQENCQRELTSQHFSGRQMLWEPPSLWCRANSKWQCREQLLGPPAAWRLGKWSHSTARHNGLQSLNCQM